MKTNWQRIGYYITIGTILIVGSFGFHNMLSQLNLFVLTLTFTVLVAYAYDTNRIANQTIESALRPIIMRQGKILDWKVNSTLDITASGFTLEFTNQKNIAKDICGHIVIDNKKYKLHFGNEVTEDVIKKNENNIGKKIILFEKWGWLPVGGFLKASYDISRFEVCSNQDNEIYIEYQDIESNKYYTRENKDFSQVSGKL